MAGLVPAILAPSAEAQMAWSSPIAIRVKPHSYQEKGRSEHGFFPIVMARLDRAMTMKERRLGQTFLRLPLIPIAMGTSPAKTID
nr:hypothetical protein [uncultured Rhodopila sp.]